MMKIRSKDFHAGDDDVDLGKWPTLVDPLYKSKHGDSPWYLAPADHRLRTAEFEAFRRHDNRPIDEDRMRHHEIE